MNWTEILKSAGIPEPPGRAEAVAEMARRLQEGLIPQVRAGSRHTAAEQARRANRG